MSVKLDDFRLNCYDSNLIQRETGIYTIIFDVVAELNQFLPETFLTEKHFPPLLQNSQVFLLRSSATCKPVVYIPVIANPNNSETRSKKMLQVFRLAN